jgi:hypothetical protein
MSIIRLKEIHNIAFILIGHSIQIIKKYIKNN